MLTYPAHEDWPRWQFSDRDRNTAAPTTSPSVRSILTLTDMKEKLFQ
jgi:hypothetical protein